MRSTTARLFVVTSILLTTIALSPVGLGGANAGDREPTIATPKPERWMPSGGNKCKSVKGLKGKMCQGPRRTPEPFGSAALLAEELELGTSKTGHHLLAHKPRA